MEQKPQTECSVTDVFGKVVAMRDYEGDIKVMKYIEKETESKNPWIERVIMLTQEREVLTDKLESSRRLNCGLGFALFAVSVLWIFI